MHIDNPDGVTSVCSADPDRERGSDDITVSIADWLYCECRESGKDQEVDVVVGIREALDEVDASESPPGSQRSNLRGVDIGFLDTETRGPYQ